MEELLPLANHAKVAIVHDSDFDGDTLLLQGSQFLYVHLDTTIASHNPDGRIRNAHFDAHGGGKSKAHGAQPTGSDVAVRARPGIVARGPHLVLPDICDDDSFSVGFRSNGLQDRSWIGILLVALDVAGEFSVPGFP